MSDTLPRYGIFKTSKEMWAERTDEHLYPTGWTSDSSKALWSTDLEYLHKIADRGVNTIVKELPR